MCYDRAERLKGQGCAVQVHGRKGQNAALHVLFRTEREKESHAQRQVAGCFLQSGAGSGRCGLQKRIPDYSTELA